jgi:hypothetical protein
MIFFHTYDKIYSASRSRISGEHLNYVINQKFPETSVALSFAVGHLPTLTTLTHQPPQ